MINLAVESDNVPGSQVIGVVPLAVAGAIGILGRSCRTEVGIVTGRTGCMIVVVTYCGTGPILVPSPGWPVAILELGCRAIRIDVVAQGENGTRDTIEKF